MLGILRKKRIKNKEAIQELNIEIFEEKFELEEICYKKYSDLKQTEIEFMQKELKKFMKIINESLSLIKLISDN
jgi:predicted HTH domain antitoxin